MSDYFEIKEDLNKVLMAMTVIHNKLKDDLGDKSISCTTDIIKDIISVAMDECIDKINEIHEQEQGENQMDLERDES